jgi:hypothetical protein
MADEPLEGDEVGHGADSKIGHEVHAAGMNLVN